MKTTLYPTRDDYMDDEWMFEDLGDYPDKYLGQDLSHRFIFMTDNACQSFSISRKSSEEYLLQFAQEVAECASRRSRRYLQSYRTGQRFLWTFPADEIVLLSLVALLPEGPRTVMWVGHGSAVCDEYGNLLHHAELCARWTIEVSVGTSTHPEKL